jgi:hypothetical protein
MTKEGNGLRLAVLAVALVEAMAIGLIFLVPEKRAIWLIAILAMPLLWIGAEATRCDKESIRYSIAGAALLVGAALAIAAARAAGLFGHDDSFIVLRLSGIVNGAILVFYGNVVPKRLVRYDPEAPDPGRRPALLRFSGWVFVLAGLADILIWLVAPVERAALWSMIPVAGGLALVAVRVLRSTYPQRSGA